MILLVNQTQAPRRRARPFPLTSPGVGAAKILARACSHRYHVRMKNAVRAKIKLATREMADAETELERVLKDMRIGLRAEKTTVTAVVEAALDRVRTARAAVAGLEAVLGDD